MKICKEKEEFWKLKRQGERKKNECKKNDDYNRFSGYVEM